MKNSKISWIPLTKIINVTIRPIIFKAGRFFIIFDNLHDNNPHVESKQIQ